MMTAGAEAKWELQFWGAKNKVYLIPIRGTHFLLQKGFQWDAEKLGLDFPYALRPRERYLVECGMKKESWSCQECNFSKFQNFIYVHLDSKPKNAFQGT